mgnify:CR=1 FL=1
MVKNWTSLCGHTVFAYPMKVLLVGRVHSVVAEGVEDVLAVAMEGQVQLE